MDDKIIFKKERQKIDYFSIVLTVFVILVLVFQITANRRISQAGRDFIAGENAKREEYIRKAREEYAEKALASQRLAKKKEEDAYLASIEERNRPEERNRFKEAQKGMDYREKLDIYRQSQGSK